MRTAFRRFLCLLSPAAALALAACAPAPIYKPSPNNVAAVPFQVAQSPAQYANGSVIWGGTVVGVRNLSDRSEVEVLAFPLDGSQRPKLNGNGTGRFIAVMNGFVEPVTYAPGSPITVSGTLAGSRTGKVGEANYVFPLVQVMQSHIWTADEMGAGRNNVHFGVGVGVGIH